MASLYSGENMERAIKEALGAHWGPFMFQGVVMIVLGVLGVLAPVAATIAIDWPKVGNFIAHVPAHDEVLRSRMLCT